MRSRLKKVKAVLKAVRRAAFYVQGFFSHIKSVYSKSLDMSGFESRMSFFPDNNSKNIIKIIFSKSEEFKYIYDADMICEQKFNLFGSCGSLGEKIDWSRDVKSGYVWPSKYFKCIEIASAHNNADIKVPWELSRFSHLITLGQAYQLTGDGKYSSAFQKQISDWIQYNPIGFSINWTCSMEVAIRAVNWISGYFYFKDADDIDSKFWGNFYESLIQHGSFIEKHLEKWAEFTNNHYIADLIGLVWLGLFFRNAPQVISIRACRDEAWLKTGIDGINREMSAQVNEDGTHYEGSTYYHKFVTEMFLLTEIICKRNKTQISDDFTLKLEKMCEFLKAIVKTDGIAPLMGDADDGRLLVFSEYYTRKTQDFRHIFALAGEYFDREDFRRIAPNFTADSHWVSGESRKGFERSKELIQHNDSKAYTNGGYYLLKNERIYCLIRCGPLACRGTGGHSHNDQLSFFLSVDGYDFFVDPGTYVYTADYSMRNLFRSTAMHNTLILEGFEQNDFEKHEIFRMIEQTFSQCLEFSSVSFIGRHFGFTKKPGLIHERQLFLQDNGLSIRDTLIGCPSRCIEGYLSFILDPEVEIGINGNAIELINGTCSVSLFTGTNSSIHIEDGFISTTYGIKEKTKKIILGNIKYNESFYLDISINPSIRNC